MGQYYYVIILASDAKFIRTWIRPTRYMCGGKLTEHSYMDSNIVAALEYLISKEGMFYKSRVVWAGDYADKEVGIAPETNLYHMTEDVDSHRESTPPTKDMSAYTYVVNHSKNVYFDKTHKSHKYALHPLPILTVEGNGRGGGDYIGSSMELVGTWARDILSVENQIPDGYTCVTPTFLESQYDEPTSK